MADQLAIELDGFPSAIRPMQAVSTEAPFRSEEYLFEVKWDGIRCVAFVDEKGRVRLQDRGLRDLTGLLPELQELGRRVEGPAVLDGELVVMDSEGRPDYHLLRRRLSRGPEGSGKVALGYIAFDLLYAHGRSLLRWPLVRRRARLKRVATSGGPVFVPDHIETEGVELFEACLERGLEGVMAKHRDSPYVPGQRSPFWLKIQAVKRDDFVVVGWTAGRGREPFGSLLIAYHEEGRLLFCGAVGGGFDEEASSAIGAALGSLASERCPLQPPPVITAPVRWCRPQLVVSVRYSEWAPDGTLRFPIFDTLRPEVQPWECVRHRPRVVLAGRTPASRTTPDLTRFPF